MRKTLITSVAQENIPAGQDWLNLGALADVEITSEDADYPIESALLPGGSSGWRAEGPGKQIIRIIFKHPQRLQRIWLNFSETRFARTQEYVLRWSPDGGQSYQEIVRQQWNFSPEGTTGETEEHRVDLPAVTVLELMIIPEIGGGTAQASLQQMLLA